MSGLDDNPFADPSVQQAARTTAPANNGLEDYNPFANDAHRAPTSNARGASNPPPVMQASSEPPPPYSQTQSAKSGHEDLLKRQEELERKAQELQRREEELNRSGTNTRANNWPPLPGFCPVQPCFYQDIQVEIPGQFQAVVKQVYYVWMLYTATLMLNVIGSLAFMLSSGDGAATQFGLSILQVFLFTPCSFLFWFRPLYKAFRNDSSFNFMVFFFVIFFHLVFVGVQALGLTSFGTWSDSSIMFMLFFFVMASQVFIGGTLAMGITDWSCGWINTLGHFGTNFLAALVMFVVAVGFSVAGVGMLFSLLKVHRMYRSTGASFAKAQAEFSTGIITNPNVQQAAAGAASAAVQNQFQQQSGGRF